MSIHVAHLVSSFDTGGLQNGVVNIINGSVPERVRHTVISMRGATGLSDRLREGEVINLALDPGRHRRAWRAVADCLGGISPDILHTRNWGTYPDGILAARKAGVSCRIHGFHGRDLANARGESLKRRIIGKFLSYGTDRFITLTESMRGEYSRDYCIPEERITVIPNGVDAGYFAGFEADSALQSPFTVLSVGRLDPVKNLPHLVQAFSGMKHRGPGDRLVICGEGPERARIEETAAQEGVGEALIMTGERDDVAAVMKAADVYVQPSIYEGMSNTIAEAMTCGVPVIATDVGGNGDVAGREGSSLLVPSGDVAALSHALDTWRSDGDARRHCGRLGQERAGGLFGLDRMVASYTEAYESAFNGRKSRKCH